MKFSVFFFRECLTWKWFSSSIKNFLSFLLISHFKDKTLQLQFFLLVIIWECLRWKWFPSGRISFHNLNSFIEFLDFMQHKEHTRYYFLRRNSEGDYSASEDDFYRVQVGQEMIVWIVGFFWGYFPQSWVVVALPHLSASAFSISLILYRR